MKKYRDARYDKEWAKFENEVINSKSVQHKMPIPPIIEIEDDRT